jgi:hypothetical protein
MPPAPRQRLLRLLLLTGGFLAALGIAWAWYYVNPRQFPTSYSFRPTNHIVNYYYKPEQVTQEVAEILATTNLFNGTFLGPQAERYSVFVGTWDASDTKQSAVVSHTPDVCWVGAGWTPVSVGHPDKLEMDFHGVKVPFEVRTFRPPGGGHLELTVWCTLISGQVFSESDRFELGPEASENNSQRQAAAGRHLLRSNLIHTILARVPGNGSKQFVRFSTDLGGDWHLALENLRRFGQRWLELQVTRHESAAH